MSYIFFLIKQLGVSRIFTNDLFNIFFYESDLFKHVLTSTWLDWPTGTFHFFSNFADNELVVPFMPYSRLIILLNFPVHSPRWSALCQPSRTHYLKKTKKNSPSPATTTAQKPSRKKKEKNTPYILVVATVMHYVHVHHIDLTWSFVWTIFAFSMHGLFWSSDD